MDKQKAKEKAKEKAEELKHKAKEKAEKAKEKAREISVRSLGIVGLDDKWHGLHVCGFWHDPDRGQLAVDQLRERGFKVNATPDRHNRSLVVIIENDQSLTSDARALMNLNDEVCKAFKPVVSWSKSDLGTKFCKLTEIHPDIFFPLHDEAFNDMMLKDFVGSRRIKDILLHKSKLSSVSSLKDVNSHFGSDVAYEFLFMSHYIRCLSVLACFAIPILVFRAATEAHMYDYVRPFMGFITIGWAVCVRYLWFPMEEEIANAWNADVEEEEEMPLFTFKPADFAKDPNYYPNWKRALRTLTMMPAVLLELLLIAFIFVCVFWFEMWVIFEWGECARINKENGNNLCRSPVGIHGFWGGVVEATPSIVEGILFEVILGISKLVAGWVVYVQNWRTLSEKQFAEVTVVFCIEAVGKIGFIANLAFSFVPEWHGDDYDCSESWDYLIFGDAALSCLKQQVPYEFRRTMLERAMKGPFFVSQLVGMLVKTIIPFLVRLFSAVAVKTKEYTSVCGRCTGWIARHVLRILEVIFYADCDVVGGIPYVWRGMPWKPPSKNRSGSFVHAPESSEERNAIKAMEECKRREFCVFDEFLEILLQFLWCTSFASVAPIFAVLAVSNFLIELRTDAVKLTYVKRRPFPKPAFQTLRWIRRSMRIATVMAMTVNICVLCYSYDSGDLIFPDWRKKGAGSNLDSVTLLAFVVWLTWGVLLLVLLPLALQRFFPARKGMRSHSQVFPFDSETGNCDSIKEEDGPEEISGRMPDPPILDNIKQDDSVEEISDPLPSAREENPANLRMTENLRLPQPEMQQEPTSPHAPEMQQDNTDSDPLRTAGEKSSVGHDSPHSPQILQKSTATLG